MSKKKPIENKMVVPWMWVSILAVVLLGLWGFATPFLKSQRSDLMVIIGFALEMFVAPLILVLGTIKITRMVISRIQRRRIR